MHLVKIKNIRNIFEKHIAIATLCIIALANSIQNKYMCVVSRVQCCITQQ